MAAILCFTYQLSIEARHVSEILLRRKQLRLIKQIPHPCQHIGSTSLKGEGPHSNLEAMTPGLMRNNSAVRLTAILTVLFIIGHALWPLPARADLAAQPAFVFVKLDKRNPSGRFVLSNTGSTAQTFRARATHFLLTEDGSIMPVKPDEYSLAEWIKFNPKEFTLPPKSSRVIRFTVVQNGRNLRPHEYWGAIQFTPLTGATYTSKPDKSGRTVSVKVITDVLIPIYGEMHETVYGGRISDITAGQSKKELTMAAMIANTGGGGLRLSGDWKIYDAGTGDLVKTIPVKFLLILPKQKRHLKTTVADHLPAGKYSIMLSLNYKDGKTKTLSGRREVEVP